MSTFKLARILNIGQSAISRSVQRGGKIAETEDFAHQFDENLDVPIAPQRG
jgi:hypothetical protein